MDAMTLYVDESCLEIRRFSIGKFIYRTCSLSDYEQT